MNKATLMDRIGPTETLRDLLFPIGDKHLGGNGKATADPLGDLVPTLSDGTVEHLQSSPRQCGFLSRYANQPCRYSSPAFCSLIFVPSACWKSRRFRSSLATKIGDHTRMGRRKALKPPVQCPVIRPLACRGDPLTTTRALLRKGLQHADP